MEEGIHRSIIPSARSKSEVLHHPVILTSLSFFIAPKIILLYPLLAFLSICLASPLFSRLSSRANNPVLNTQWCQVVCGDTIYGPDAFTNVAEAFKAAQSNPSPLVQEYLVATPDIPKDYYNDLIDQFYYFPMSKTGRFPHGEHNGKDFAVVAGTSKSLVDVIVKENDPRPCERQYIGPVHQPNKPSIGPSESSSNTID
ncbi:hypothetical protein K3495_g4637 [Podosphaera aphanis]|nr:hypothetical protein K3495_g4637 [Podosphaera aphanis]